MAQLDVKIIADPPLAVLRRELAAVDQRFKKEIQKANKALAKHLADDVRAAYEADHSGGRGRGAKSIRALASQSRAQLAIGTAKTPYVQGQNFGGHRFPQFPTKRDPDWYLFATVEDSADRIRRLYLAMIDDLMHQAFPEGRGL